MLDDAERICWIGNFFVDNKFRKRGIGKMLWDRLWNSVQNVPTLGLMTEMDHSLRPFYEKNGFTIDPRNEFTKSALIGMP